MIIRESVFDILPRLELILNDDGIFSDLNPINSGTEIVVVVSLGENEDVIRQVFEVVSHSYFPDSLMDNKMVIHSINAIFKATEFMAKNYSDVFSKMTFGDTLDHIANKTGVNTNKKLKTKDVMDWYIFNESPLDYLTTATQKSYVGDNDCPLVYVDRHGDLCLDSIKTASTQSNKIYLYKDPIKALTEINEEDVSYFSTYSYLDISSLINKVDGGVGFSSMYYDGDGIKTDEIRMRDGYGLTDRINISKGEDIDRVKQIYYGLQDSSLHQNYFKAISINSYIRNRFFSSPFVVSCKANTNINLLSKIDVQFIRDSVDSSSVNLTYSGDYLVGSITHQLGNLGTYSMVLALFRDGQNEKQFIFGI